MANAPYRVIQWATGNVGEIAIRHFLANPTYDLVGALVTNPAKVGKDVGEIAGLGPVGVTATDDIEAIIAMDADCVHFAPLHWDAEMVCRLLRSGKNVVSPAGPFHPWGAWKPRFQDIAAACRDGGTSYHGSGIHPGFAGDLLPVILNRLMDRIDHIHASYTIDYQANPTSYIQYWGFGRDPDDLDEHRKIWADAPEAYGQSMAIVAEGLGKTLERVTAEVELATAIRDVPYPGGVVKAGTIAGQHYQAKGWVDGAPLITFHRFVTMGPDNIEPRWDCGDSGYRVRIDGDPPLDMSLTGQKEADGTRKYFGLPWTAMAGVNTIPAVCDAPPGVITHFDLGVLRMPWVLKRR